MTRVGAGELGAGGLVGGWQGMVGWLLTTAYRTAWAASNSWLLHQVHDSDDDDDGDGNLDLILLQLLVIAIFSILSLYLASSYFNSFNNSCINSFKSFMLVFLSYIMYLLISGNSFCSSCWSNCINSFNSCINSFLLVFLFLQYPTLAPLQPFRLHCWIENMSIFFNSYNWVLYFSFIFPASLKCLISNDWDIFQSKVFVFAKFCISEIIRRCLFQKCTETYFPSSLKLKILNSEFQMKFYTSQSTHNTL